MSILTVAVGINNAYELCVPESRKLENNILPPGALLCFRWCDNFSRIGAWALLGMCLRPIGAKLHGVQQPYLPLILAAELLLITAVLQIPKFRVESGIVSALQERISCQCHGLLPWHLLVLQYGRFSSST